MSARSIFESAPLGAMVQFSDGTPRPPARFTRKLAAWENKNNGGRLVRKVPARTVGNYTSPASFTLHQGDFGSRGVVVLKIFKTFSVDSALTFTVVERPAPGTIRVLNQPGENGELVHLAGNRGDAETWLKSHGYPNAVLDEVIDDDRAPTSLDGRAA